MKFNYCSVVIKEKLFSRKDVPVLTIEKFPSNKGNPKFNFKFKSPEILSPKIKPEIEFKPDVVIHVAMASHRVMRLNGLVFVTIRDNKGNIIEKKIEKKGVERNKVTKSYVTNALLIIDKANKRIRLSGRKTSPEWVKVDKI